MTDPAGLGAAFFAQDVRLLQQLAALLEKLLSRGALHPEAVPGSGAIALYGVYITWFMAYLSNDAIGLDTLRAQVREGIGVVMHGLLPPNLSGVRAQQEDSS